MSWDVRDTRTSTPAGEAKDTTEPVSPAMLPTLAIVQTLDDWLDDPLTLDNLPPAEQAEWLAGGLVPPSQWAAIRKLMTRGIVEIE